jgi:hypothetical protein
VVRHESNGITRHHGARMSKRYRVDKKGGGDFQVVDTTKNFEVCVTSDHEGYEDGEARANHIADLLNKAEAAMRPRRRR